jgi:UDPglucose--hexose-1-phosphate uridylyltransferase
MTKVALPDLAQHPHRRFNPLTREWVLVSPHRTARPWQGQQEERMTPRRPHYDESCYLCPGNARAGGQQNPDYDGTFVFVNDFSALLPSAGDGFSQDDPLFSAQSETGVCKVICFSERHDLSVPYMPLEDVAAVVRVWIDEYRAFCETDSIAYAQIFENKGSIMGCSNPHPHCQIWASGHLPDIVAREQDSQRAYLDRFGAPMLVDYVNRELERETRLVYRNEYFAVVVPFWAVWPFETLILPRAHLPSIADFSPDETVAFADAYRTLTRAYDRVFDCEFPYTAGIHQAPTTRANRDSWQLHMHFFPPLLRSATVRKFMVGYEMLATPQRDVTAESAAAALRHALSLVR